MQVWACDSFVVRKAPGDNTLGQAVCVSAALLSPLPTSHFTFIPQSSVLWWKTPLWPKSSLHFTEGAGAQHLFSAQLDWDATYTSKLTTQSQRIKEEYGKGGGNRSSSVHVKGPPRAWEGKWHIQRHWKIGGRDTCHFHPLHFCLLQIFRKRHCLESWHHFPSSFHCLNCNIYYFYNWIFNLQTKGQSFKKKIVLFPKLNTI